MESHWRSQFPAIEHGKLIYLDNAATTHKPQVVIDAVADIYTRSNAPVHRSFYEEAELLTERYEGVRQKIACWMGAVSPVEIVLTRGTTDGINTFIGSWALAALGLGDEIVVTALDHHAILLPWLTVAQKAGARMVTIPLVSADSLLLDVASLERFITRRTKIVCIPLSSNIRGPLLESEIAALVDAARAVGALVLFDAAQVPAHGPIDLQKWNPDVVVWSGHKCFAPTGVGVLYIRRSLHDQLSPYQCGGGMVYDAQALEPVWLPMPHLLEAGTRSVEAVIGLGVAVDYMIQHVQYSELRAHEVRLMSVFLDELQDVPMIRFLGDVALLKQQSSLVTFAVEGIHAHDIAAYFAHNKIAVRAGHHCCQRLHATLGLASTVRVSFALYNTEQEAYVAAQALKEAIRYFAQ